MRYIPVKFLSVILLSLLFSCGKKEDPSTEGKDTISQNRMQKITKEPDNTSVNPNQNPGDTSAPKNNAPVNLKWEFKTLGEGEYGQPITLVSLVFNGNKIEIAKIEFGFNETGKDSYKDFHIPSDAMISCRGWWAGAGIDYWVIRKGNDLVVMAKEIGETSDENGEPGDYEETPKLIKSIKIE